MLCSAVARRSLLSLACCAPMWPLQAEAKDPKLKTFRAKMQVRLGASCETGVLLSSAMAQTANCAGAPTQPPTQLTFPPPPQKQKKAYKESVKNIVSAAKLSSGPLWRAQVCCLWEVSRCIGRVCALCALQRRLHRALLPNTHLPRLIASLPGPHLQRRLNAKYKLLEQQAEEDEEENAREGEEEEAAGGSKAGRKAGAAKKQCAASAAKKAKGGRKGRGGKGGASSRLVASDVSETEEEDEEFEFAEDDLAAAAEAQAAAEAMQKLLLATAKKVGAGGVCVWLCVCVCMSWPGAQSSALGMPHAAALLSPFP